MNTAYTYVRSEPGLWTTGYYDPDGKWQPDSDHGSQEEAATRVHWLNGGSVESVATDVLHELTTVGLSQDEEIRAEALTAASRLLAGIGETIADRVDDGDDELDALVQQLAYVWTKVAAAGEEYVRSGKVTALPADQSAVAGQPGDDPYTSDQEG